MKKNASFEIEANFQKMYHGPMGKEKVAAVMSAPIKRDLLHEGRTRQLLSLYQLGLGEEFYLDTDITVPGAMISTEGLPDSVEVRSERDFVQTSAITAKAFARWTETNRRKFDLLNRIQQRGKASIMTQEDKRALALVEYVASQHYDPVVSSGNVLTLDAIAKMKATMAAGRNRPSRLVIHAIREADIDMLYRSTAGSTSSTQFMPESAEKVMESGTIGKVLNIPVLSVPDGEGVVRRTGPSTETIVDVPLMSRDVAYLLAPADYLGAFVVRTDITIETMKNLDLNADVFSIWEDVGFYIRNAKGAGKISIVS